MTRALLLLALAACSCAAHAEPSGYIPGTFPYPAGSHAIRFTIPRFHALAFHPELPDSANPLSPGMYRWEIGVSSQSRVWRDSVEIVGPAWGRDLENMPKWLPGAQVYPLGWGYAQPGQEIVAPVPLVASIAFPFTCWVRACTDSCAAWSRPVATFTGN